MNIIACMSSIKVQLKCSATPFWEGECGAMNSISTLRSRHHVSKVLLTYSLPLSAQSHLGHLPQHASAYDKYCCTFVVASSVFFKYCMVHQRVQSSINNI